MIEQQIIRRIAVSMGLVCAAAAADVPACAAPIFGAAETTVSNCISGSVNPVTGMLNATPVNSGAGVVLAGSASSGGTGGFCLNLEWTGTLGGSIDATNAIPIAFDYTVDFTGVLPTFVQSDLYFEIRHEPYVSQGFNQSGYCYSSPSVDGTGRFTSAPGLNLEWPGPTDGTPRVFRSYYARLLLSAESLGPSIETLSVNVPAASSIELGVVRATSVPAPEVGALMGIGLLAASWLRRRSG